jgi:short-subunit dehydrogenase
MVLGKSKPMYVIYLILLSLIIFQIILILTTAWKGLYKYFFMKELNLLERYGSKDGENGEDGESSWVVITGASSGQGYEMAMAFAKRGFNLLLIGSKRTDKTIEEINKEYPSVKTKVIYKDFRKAHTDDFFNDIQTTFDEIGDDLAILVNNVGHRVAWNPYHEMDAGYIRDVISTGTIVQSRLTHMCIPGFIKRGKNKQHSALINITAQCMHPNFLFGVTMTNEISLPYLSVYEAANAFGFYQGSSIYKEYQGVFDILNITPGAVVTENTKCLSDTFFNVTSKTYVKHLMRMIGNVQGSTCAYWGHAFSNYLINLAPNMKDGMLKKVGETLAVDFMQKSKRDYTIEADTNE